MKLSRDFHLKILAPEVKLELGIFKIPVPVQDLAKSTMQQSAQLLHTAVLAIFYTVQLVHPSMKDSHRDNVPLCPDLLLDVFADGDQRPCIHKLPLRLCIFGIISRATEAVGKLI